MKKLFFTALLFGSTVLAQISDQQVKSISFEGHVSIKMEESNLELWNDRLTLQTDVTDVAQMTDFLLSKGVQLMSGIYGNESSGLIVASVKLVEKNNELSVMVFDTKPGQIYFYNISSVADGVITSKDEHYSDLIFKITKD